MPLKDPYGVLKARVVQTAGFRRDHYQMHLRGGGTDFRVPVNVRSNARGASESERALLYAVREDFHHPITAMLDALPEGWTPLASRPGGLALDYPRLALLERTQMRVLVGHDNSVNPDLTEVLDFQMERVRRDPAGMVYAFGGRWGPEPHTPDQDFHFLPGDGVHEIHLNQGNAADHRAEDGVWQDGALLLSLPAEARWVAIFFAFQNQAWDTDDAGHRLADAPVRDRPHTDAGATPADAPSDIFGAVRVVAALVNPRGPAPEAETVTLLNTTDAAVDVEGWQIVDRLAQAFSLHGSIPAGEAMRVRVAPPTQLGNGGGTITLRDGRGRTVDGASYTREQAHAEGRTVVFGRR